MTLKNSWHTELAIGILIHDENDLDTKLSLLTEIGLTTKNEETFSICEKFRDRLCAEENLEERNSVPPPIYKRAPRDGEAPEECNETNGEA